MSSLCVASKIRISLPLWLVGHVPARAREGLAAQEPRAAEPDRGVYPGAVSTDLAMILAHPAAPDLELLAEEAAVRQGVPIRELMVRLLLHLPRLADHQGMVTKAEVSAESGRLASLLADKTSAYAHLQRHPAPPVSLGSLPRGLSAVDEELARVVLERFHYLGSYRDKSLHLGAFAGDRLAAMFTISPLDVPTIAENLPAGVGSTDAVVLSRVFAFDWAPRNTLSFAISALVRVLRQRDHPPRALLTYVNPNVGFTGASYRAANWSLWARETGTRYAYLDRQYVTDRELRQRFPGEDVLELAKRLGSRLQLSRMQLSPLDLYAYALDPGLRDELRHAHVIQLPHPEP